MISSMCWSNYIVESKSSIWCYMCFNFMSVLCGINVVSQSQNSLMDCICFQSRSRGHGQNYVLAKWIWLKKKYLRRFIQSYDCLVLISYHVNYKSIFYRTMSAAFILSWTHTHLNILAFALYLVINCCNLTLNQG